MTLNIGSSTASTFFRSYGFQIVRAAMVALVVLALLFPRFTSVIALAVICVSLLGFFLTDRVLPSRRLELKWLSGDAVTWSMAGSLGVFLIACTWSVVPLEAARDVLFLVAVCVSALLLIRQSADWSPAALTALAQGLVIGMTIGSFYILIETVTDRELTRTLHLWFPILSEGFEKHLRFDKHGNLRSVSHAVINRATFTYSLLLWPTLLALSHAVQGRFRIVAAAVIGITVAAIIAKSTHQSSQLSIPVSLVVFLIACLSVRWARVLVAAGVCTLFLAIIPFSLYAQHAGLHTSSDVPTTARARLIFWAYTSERVLEKPVLGVGTASTEALDTARNPTKLTKPPGYIVAPRTSIHPHNSYLQIWYETGALGAFASLAFALALLWSFARWPARDQRYALGFYTLAVLITMPSYGLWQTWFQAVVGFAAVGLVVAARVPRRT